MTGPHAGLPKLLLALIALLPGFATAGDTTTYFYSVTVDDSLSRLQVEARFSRPVSRISARSRRAGSFLLEARYCAGENKIRTRNRRMLLPADGIQCLDYTVNLKHAAREYRYAKNLTRQNIVASAALWLWRPDPGNGINIHIEFHLPDDIRVSVPWRRLDDSRSRYLLGDSPENANAPIVFGRFDLREIDVPGSTLRLALLSGKSAMKNDEIADWIRATATDVSLAYGRFPNPSPQVVVVPVASGGTAVPFGQVIRDGGETVELTINPTQPLDEFLGDWKATHEFSHLMLPYITRRHRWIPEGFAQFYQNILLARSGAYAANYAWQKISAGMLRGQKSRPRLSPNEAAASGVRSGRMKVYWSGAALALIADVQLRQRSDGMESLDIVLGRFQACCLPSKEIWSGPDFFAKLDTLIHEPIFMPLYRRFADTAGFPATSEVFAQLGVSVADGKIDLLDDAELRNIRDAITATDAPTARWRDHLSAQ